MSEASDRLKARTENFAVAVVTFCETLPNTIAGRKIAGQLIDAGARAAFVLHDLEGFQLYEFA